ncbi:MAG: hypothetical protein RLZZ515_440 [Cyanobacteriota bacterium]|jgi:hypothetical protein
MYQPEFTISTPQQQVSSVIATRDFLLRLTRPKETPRVTRDVRWEARALLRHYPLPERLRPILQAGLVERTVRPVD